MNGVSSDDRLWALLAHFSYFVFAVFGPLIIWLVKREESAFVENQAKEALNFQLSVLIISFVCGATVCLLPASIILAIVGLVYSILAGIKAYEGQQYQYPYNIRLIK